MELDLSVPLTFVDGVAVFQFPDALRREMFKSTIQLDSFYLSKNANAKNEALMVVCNGSFYRDRNQKLQKNVLGLFINKPRPNLFTFTSHPVPINLPLDSLEVEIIAPKGERQKVSGLGVLHVKGSVHNRFLTI